MLFFEPIKGKSFKQLYPEVDQIEEFADLDNKELEFVWYYAYPDSPHIKKDPRQRAIMAFDEAWGADQRIGKTNTKLVNYSSGIFPEHIKSAIERMKTIKPGARKVARETTQNIFDTIIEIGNTRIDDLKDAETGQLNVEKAAKFTTLAMNIAKELPAIVERIEIGYSGSRKGNQKDIDTGKKMPRLADKLLSE